jgi:hypothetical protein
MSRFPLYVLLLWAGSAAAQLLVLVLLVPKRKFRRLPLFTTYAALNLCQIVFLVAVYSASRLTEGAAKDLAWYSECVTLFAQALATTEILKVTLRPYQGIWGLAWRALTFTSTVVLLLVAMATRGSWSAAKWFEINRGYHLTFATAVIACLLLIRYYSIQVPAVYKMILAGFCFYSCTEILINTVLETVLKKSFGDYQPIWQSATMLSFIVVLFIWAAALWAPLPVEARPPDSPADSMHGRLSPEINERLRELNEKLLRLWKQEALQ